MALCLKNNKILVNSQIWIKYLKCIYNFKSFNYFEVQNLKLKNILHLYFWKNNTNLIYRFEKEKMLTSK